MSRLDRVDTFTALVVGAVSLTTPLHFDEAFWVSIASMVTEHDRVLYETAIDNKSPLVYLVSGVLDWLPGPYVAARSVAVGMMGGLLAIALRRLGLGVRLRMVAVGVAVLASGLVLTIELPALVLLAWALVSLRFGRPWLGVVTIATASLFDSRVALIGLVIVAIATRQLGWSTVARPVLVLFFAGSASLTAIFSIDRLRYGLVELNLASRAAVQPPTVLDIAVTMLLVVFPVAWLAFEARGLSPDGWLLAGTAGVVALASLNPFHHYWVYLVLALPFVSSPGEGHRSHPDWMVAVVLLPLIATVLVEGSAQRRVLDDYRDASVAISEVVPRDGAFAQFALVPYPYFFSRVDIALDAPGIHYLTWVTSRQERQLQEVAMRIGEAVAIVHDGGLDVPPEAVAPSIRPLRKLFDDELVDMSCVARWGSVAVLTRAECDPSG